MKYLKVALILAASISTISCSNSNLVGPEQEETYTIRVLMYDGDESKSNKDVWSDIDRMSNIDISHYGDSAIAESFLYYDVDDFKGKTKDYGSQPKTLIKKLDNTAWQFVKVKKNSFIVSYIYTSYYSKINYQRRYHEEYAKFQIVCDTTLQIQYNNCMTRLSQMVYGEDYRKFQIVK
jgi:hypothetical protein